MESQSLLTGRTRQPSSCGLVALASKLVVLFATGLTMYNAAVGSVDYWRSGGLQQCTSQVAYSLSNDCFRLGVAWPLVNALLAAVVFGNLVVVPWISPSGQQSQARAMLSFHDNRLSVASLTAAVALVAVANSATFVIIGSRDTSGGARHEQVYWQATLAFWAVAVCAFGRDFVHTRRHAHASVFHWTLIMAVLVQALVCGLVEGFYEFFTGQHVAEPVGQSLHSQFVMLSAVIGLVAAMLPLYAHRQGFYLPTERRSELATEQATENMELTVGPDVKAFELHTPLTRVRANQIPIVVSPEQSHSIIGQLVFSWVTPVLSKGTKVTIDSSDLYHLDSSDKPLSIWRRYVSCRGSGRPLLRALGLTFAPQLCAQGMLALLNAMLAFANPFFMQRILRAIRLYNQGDSEVPGSKRMIYLDAIGLLLSSLLHSLSSNQVLWIGRKVSLRLQSLLVAELSSKALRRRSKSSAPTEKESEDAKKDDSQDTTAASDGRVANMLTSDLESVGHISSYLNEIYTLPIEFVIGSWYLYNLLGVSALIGLAITVIYYPLTKLMVKYLIKYQRQLMKLDDERVTMLTEVFYGIRAVKLFGWQSRFVAKVQAKRDEEISAWWRLMILQLPVSFVRSLTTSLILVVILAIYALVFGHTLTADVVFPAITVFSMVSATFNSIPGIFRWMAGCYVSLTRIETFMVQSQIQGLEERVKMSPGSSEGEIGFVNASFVWGIESSSGSDSESSSIGETALPKSNGASRSASASTLESTEQTPLASSRQSTSYGAITPNTVDDEDDEAMTPVTATATANKSDSPNGKTTQTGMIDFKLSDITLRFPTGGMSIIVGSTGAGKSSLLSALIGEMSLTQGHINLPTVDPRVLDAQLQNGKYREVIELASLGTVMTDVAYVSQEAWLRNATIRENILFGEVYDADRYEEVLRVCALKPDLRLMAAGDRTEIGERGITLSGGQKQRVALARAVFSRRRILLIDDCLSAVDAHTAKHILNECLVGKTGLMQGRTRVLVTHHVSACLPHSDYVAVLRNGRVALSGTPKELQMMGHFSTEILSLDRGSQEADKEKEDSSEGEQDTINVNDTKSEDTYNSERSQGAGGDEGMLVEDEEREQGYVRPQVWFEYMRMCGGWVFWTVVVMFVFINRAAGIAQDYWVRLWMSEANSGGASSSDVSYWLGMYILLGMVSTALRLASSINETVGALRAARKYHEMLFSRLINAMPRFFDCTPIGRVISRFSRDMRTIDDSILGSITVLIMQITQVGSVFGIISMVTPPFVVIALAMIVAYTLMAIYYLNATRELKRLDSISMSPLLSLFSELITGVESIRAFGAQNQYTMEAMNRVDVHNRPFYMLWAANRWLCARIEFSGCIVSFSTTVLIVTSLDNIDAGLAGFVLMYAISFSDYMLWFIRNYSECEISMNSVERVNQYLVLEQEASQPATETFLPDTWPTRGSIEVKDLTIEYVPDSPVLHDLTFSVKHGEKIGVVGRTGAGKSTLSLAFLRFIEAARGSISIDGVDISKIALDDLRRRVTIIPQDPVLFNGTIRFNLDPFDEYPDELVWDALKRAHLVRDKTGTDSDESSECNSVEAGAPGTVLGMNEVFTSLEAEIKENGQNLSLGQRQLVAIARALVRRSRLVILDEATASVDFELDSRIQRTIRGPEFADSSLFCIAHRLRTIIDYDRVLVLDKGRIAEFDTPWNLIQIPGGSFRSMCEKSGEFEHLFSAAERANMPS
ncbi:hypothetical protein GGF45_000941 [Coemansia sp. RSA 551]|nr:hypothetical protein GGF45_000941 [Coemansia sp. RSA 551]KAJ2257516.1 hypothetical protein GGH98_000781 [Coemansia sp. RSA 454]KAJ2429576.1 hypothetical protein GGF47_000647 [Coemansia sp. RSA 2524]